MSGKNSRKNKPGRPTTDASKLRKHVLTVRLSDEELLALHAKSQLAKLSYSTFLRVAGLGGDLPCPVPEINIKTFQNLGRIGSNLNQLLRRLYDGKLDHFPPDLLQELISAIHAVRKEVIGK